MTLNYCFNKLRKIAIYESITYDISISMSDELQDIPIYLMSYLYLRQKQTSLFWKMTNVNHGKSPKKNYQWIPVEALDLISTGIN